MAFAPDINTKMRICPKMVWRKFSARKKHFSHPFAKISTSTRAQYDEWNSTLARCVHTNLKIVFEKIWSIPVCASFFLHIFLRYYFVFFLLEKIESYHKIRNVISCTPNYYSHRHFLWGHCYHVFFFCWEKANDEIWIRYIVILTSYQFVVNLRWKIPKSFFSVP